MQNTITIQRNWKTLLKAVFNTAALIAHLIWIVVSLIAIAYFAFKAEWQAATFWVILFYALHRIGREVYPTQTKN